MNTSVFVLLTFTVETCIFKNKNRINDDCSELLCFQSFLDLDHALCIMHYASCIASCIMHYALMHSVAYCW